MTLLFKCIVYGILLYNIFHVNEWIAVGFALTFLLIEVIGHNVGTFKATSLAKLQEIDKTAKEIEATINRGQITTQSTEIVFVSEPLTKEELDLIPAVKAGDVESINKFLHSRCVNKEIDFNTSGIPLEVKNALALNLINEIEGRTDTHWDDLLED